MSKQMYLFRVSNYVPVYKFKFPHKHDLVYHAKCAEESCNNDYVSKMARCISERVLDHSGRDKHSHILKHQLKKEHPYPQYENFKVTVVASGTTLRRKNYQKRCGLTLLTFFKQAGVVYSSQAF